MDGSERRSPLHRGEPGVELCSCAMLLQVAGQILDGACRENLAVMLPAILRCGAARPLRSGRQTRCMPIFYRRLHMLSFFLVSPNWLRASPREKTSLPLSPATLRAHNQFLIFRQQWRLFAAESSEPHEKPGEGSEEPDSDAQQPDGETLLRRELINQARPRAERAAMTEMHKKHHLAEAEESFEEKAKRSTEHLNDVLSRKFFAWNIVGLGNTLGLLFLCLVLVRLAHFIYQTRVHLKYQRYADDYAEMAEEDSFNELMRPQENAVPFPTATRVPATFSVKSQDTSAVRQQVADLETVRAALENQLTAKRDALEPRWSVFAPVEKLAYTISTSLALAKTMMTWPGYVDTPQTLLDDFEPHPSVVISGKAKTQQEERGFDTHSDSSLLGHLPGPDDAVYGRPITLLLDTELLLAPGIDKEAGIVNMKRPGIENFMSRVAPYAEIVFISVNHDEEEAQGICEKLDPYNFRTGCLHEGDTWRYKYRAAKPLDARRLGRPQGRVVAFDRDYELCGTNCDNVLLLSPFRGTRGDSALVDTIPFIQFLAIAAQQGRDVREIIGHYRGIPIDKAVKFMKNLAEEERAQAANADKISGNSAK